MCDCVWKCDCAPEELLLSSCAVLIFMSSSCTPAYLCSVCVSVWVIHGAAMQTDWSHAQTVPL